MLARPSLASSIIARRWVNAALAILALGGVALAPMDRAVAAPGANGAKAHAGKANATKGHASKGHASKDDASKGHASKGKGDKGAHDKAAHPKGAHPKGAHSKATQAKGKSDHDEAKKKATPPARATAKAAPPPPLDGNTYDFEYDGSASGHPERSFSGRSFLHTKLGYDPSRPQPIFVFLHGMNTEQIKYRWMGGGQEGDVRRIMSALMESEQIAPMIVAGPSTTDAVTASNALLLWPGFDLDTFLDQTEERLRGLVTIDRSRVIVAGHSGAGCNVRGGLSTALKSKTSALAGLVIDTCLLVDEAVSMARVRPATKLIVSWQSISWGDRYFDDFRNAFTRELKKQPAAAGALRELDFQQPSVASPHDAMVGITLRKWLPRLMPGPAVKDVASADTSDAREIPGG